MEGFQGRVHGNGLAENGHHVRRRQSRHQQGKDNINLSLPWLNLRVFFVRISKCKMDDSMPEYLRLNHVPLNRDTLLEVNGARTSIYSDGVSTLLRRDRLHKKSEEVTFVSTDTMRTTGSVKFEVFDKDVLMLSGALELRTGNGFVVKSGNLGQSWSINCESDILGGIGGLSANRSANLETASPAIEVYVAGCFSGFPIILTKTLQLSPWKKPLPKAMLESIPEDEETESPKDVSLGLAMQVADYLQYKPDQNESNDDVHPGMECIEGEDGELSWFNAGVRVGVGIGLSISLGVGIGVGLLVKTYQGTTTNLRKRLL